MPFLNLEPRVALVAITSLISYFIVGILLRQISNNMNMNLTRGKEIIEDHCDALLNCPSWYYSHLIDNISDREHHYTNIVDYRTWIAPTVYAGPSFEDFIKGRDAVWGILASSPLK